MGQPVSGVCGARWGTLGHVAWNASIQIRIDPFPTAGPLGTRRLLGSGTPASSWLMLLGCHGQGLGKGLKKREKRKNKLCMKLLTLKDCMPNTNAYIRLAQCKRKLSPAMRQNQQGLKKDYVVNHLPSDIIPGRVHVCQFSFCLSLCVE